MIINSFSKINLTLKVNSKSKNGLHEIQTFYCWINLVDKISIVEIKKNKDRIIFKGPFAKLVKNRNNTVYKLLKKLRQLNLISNYYSIVITKNIPIFSGLGGGTGNAAFILKYLLKNKISNDLLKNFDQTYFILIVVLPLIIFSTFHIIGFIKWLFIMKDIDLKFSLYVLSLLIIPILFFPYMRYFIP